MSVQVHDRSDLTSWGAPRSNTIPWAFQDEVELWARQNRGTHGRIVWNQVMHCPVVELELRASDPRLKAWRDGKLKHHPKEVVPLHRWNTSKQCYEAIDLEQLGVDGLKELLDKGNLWSGRGEHRDMLSAVRAADEHNQRLEQQMKDAMVEAARFRARDDENWYKGNPQVAVPVTLENGTNGPS